MAKETVRGVLKTCPTSGTKMWAGYVAEETVVPAELMESPVEVFNDGSDRWVLASPDALTELDSTALAALANGEVRARAVAKLTDQELDVLGVEREP